MSDQATQCLECGAALSAAEAKGLCAKCLLKLGLASEFGAPSVAGAGQRLPVPPPLLPFEFGGYRVLHLLGRGGMGAVYEAEQLSTGRRVALKVLGHTIDSPEMRKRFLREGRLAAAVSHPNTVHIFGTEEIDSTPVISMELVGGGALKDEVKRRGPLPVRESVDTILQVIAGLEAAQTGGVLHRDVKPANCFIDSDGTVKVGDFGLSVSTLARGDSQLTASGVLLGTPSFAPPEQLRGEELDVRADIYSVGATLYYLLSGRAPHEGQNVVNVVAAVLDCAPEPLAKLRTDIPAELAAVITRMLAKNRAQRFGDYAALREALLPFSSAAPEPAPLGLRFVAGVVDELVAYTPAWLGLAIFAIEPATNLLIERTAAAWLFWISALVFYLSYYGLLEGLTGAAGGKRLCGLRVARPDGDLPGLARATLRALILWASMNLLYFVDMARTTAAEYTREMTNFQPAVADFGGIITFGVLWVTMRRRNGFAALQDLASKTRVVVRAQAPARLTDAARPAEEVREESARRIGPYFAPMEAEGERLHAFDPVLRRNVLLRASEEARLSPARRMVSRAGRLRWIQTVSDEGRSYEVFSAPPGRSLPTLLADGRRSWATVRLWLDDLAQELDAASRDRTLPREISIDHVWITASGRAVLLDEPWENGAGARFDPADVSGAQYFLHDVAAATLHPATVPLHARPFLQNLATASLDRLSFIAGNLQSLLARPAVVPVQRRTFSLLIGPVLVAGFAVLTFGVMRYEFSGLDDRWAKRFPGAEPLPRLMRLHDAVTAEPGDWLAVEGFNPPAQLLAALEQYIARSYRFVAADQSFWMSNEAYRYFWGDQRNKLEKLFAEEPQALTAEEWRRIDSLVAPWSREFAKHERTEPRSTALLAVATALGLVAVMQIVSLSIFRTSLGLRLFGLAIIRNDGREAGRLRLVWRAVVAWAPAGVVIAIIGSIGSMDFSEPGQTWLVLAACLGYAAVFLLQAKTGRGPHDWLAQTRVVPC